MRIEKPSDCWETPKWLYEELDKEFSFVIDLCASKTNKKARNYCKDYLTEDLKSYYTYSAFMNPPYSNPFPFIKKAYQDSKFCKIVLLIKCDTSTKSWGIFWDYNTSKPKPGCEVRFLPKRLKFERCGISSKNCANFPSVVVIMDRRGLND